MIVTPPLLASAPATLGWAADTTPAPSPSATPPVCQSDALCDFIYTQTGQRWLAESSYFVLVKPVRIIGIVLVALLLRHLVYRMIRRLTEGSVGETPGLLRPLKERIPSSLQEVAGGRSERRRQRAQALGSVLRSGATITIFAVAAMMILAELGVELAPLIASAGIAGLALGFGAQNLVKDFIAGLFMLLEDQYGVGDLVDLGAISGTVEAVGLRVTTVRDGHGVLWYLRNGEIVRVGNRSQGWSMVIVDVPVGFGGIEEAITVLRAAARGLSADPEMASGLLEAPEVVGVEQITADGAVIRVSAKTTAETHRQIGNELRRRLTEAIEVAGISRRAPSADRTSSEPLGGQQPQVNDRVEPPMAMPDTTESS